MSTLAERPSSISQRIEQLQHEDGKRREEAARILGMMRESAHESVPALAIALSDESPDVRLRAAWAIAMIGPTDDNDVALDALRRLAQTPNETLRQAANRAIESLQPGATAP